MYWFSKAFEFTRRTNVSYQPRSYVLALGQAAFPSQYLTDKIERLQRNVGFEN